MLKISSDSEEVAKPVTATATCARPMMTDSAGPIPVHAARRSQRLNCPMFDLIPAGGARDFQASVEVIPDAMSVSLLDSM